MQRGCRASSRCTDARSVGGSNCTGVEIARIHAPARAVELAVADAEGVAGEPAAAAFVPQAVVVLRMARRVRKLQPARAQRHDHAVLGDGRCARPPPAAACRSRAPPPRRRRSPAPPAAAPTGRPCGAGRAGAAACARRAARCISSPAPPAWSRCTCEGITQSTASRSRPSACSVASSRGTAKLVPVSKKAARPLSTSR